MAQIKNVQPVRLFCGIIATTEQLVDDAVSRLAETFGSIHRCSQLIPFTFTNYYAREMGPYLLRLFVSFQELRDPSELVPAKLRTNELEEEWARETDDGTRRQVNLDPGYVTPAKLVLATAKNFAHRIYLAEGIYGEVTLNFKKGGITTFPWTYPDFMSEEYQEFFIALREELL